MEVSTVLGSVAAVFTPLLLATGFTLWDVHWTGSAVVLNALKGSVASVLFVIASVALLVGQVQGPGKSGFNAGMLVLSSVIGIVIGDTVWLQALELIGARRVILVDSIKPFLAAVLAVPIFKEPLRPLGILGMVVTMASVVVVSLENDKDETHPLVVEDRFKRLPHHEHEHQEDGLMESQFTTSGASIDEHTVVVVLEGATDVENIQQSGEEAPVDQSVESQESLARVSESATREEHNSIAQTPPAPVSHLVGYCLSAVNVVLDVLGSVLTKKFGAGFNTFEVSGIRFGSAAIMLVSFLLGTRLYQRSYRRLIRKAPGLSNSEWWEFPSLSRTSLAFVLLGVISTTFGAVALSNFAIFQLPLATFSILTALTPIWSIPVVYFLKGERCSFRAIIGSFFAVAGIAPLYLEL